MPKDLGTSQKLTLRNMQTQLTFSQEDFPASHTASQGNGKAKRMNAICGQKCLEQLEKFSRPTLWARMFSASLIGMGDWYSTKCRLTWKLRGTKYSRLYFQLVPKTHPTEGTEFGLWPTPTSVQRDHPERVIDLIEAGGTTMMSRANGENRPNSIVDAAMFYSMLPTPTAMDSTGATANMKSSQVKEGSMHSVTLSRWANMLPTPREAASRGNCSNDRNKGNLEDAIAKLLPTPDCSDRRSANSKQQGLSNVVAGKASQLNPQFVAEMMGFPTGWTVLPFQNGAMSP